MKPTNNKRDPDLRLFLLLAFSISWIFWIPATLLGSASPEPIVFLLYLIGGFGPTVAGLLMIGRTMDKNSQQVVLSRLIQFRNISWKWYMFIFLIFPILGLLATQVYRLIHGSQPVLPALDGFTGQPGDFITLVFVAFQVLLMGPLAEEIGWRGFALDRLQVKTSPLMASLVLGIIWSLWHLPLFFIQGSMYADWGFGTGLFWLFILRMTALSVIMTRVYNATHQSILSAVLLHFAFNFTFGFLQPAPDEIHLYGTIIIFLLAVGITPVWSTVSK